VSDERNNLKSFDPTQDRFLTADEVAEMFGLHVKTVQRLSAKGQLPGVKYGRSWRFRLSDVLECHRQRSVGGSRGKEEQYETRARTKSNAPQGGRLAGTVLVHEPERRKDSLPPSDFFKRDKTRGRDAGS